MIKNILQSFIDKKCCTLLGVGPMSTNCIDTAIEISNIHSIPIMLIASRRQIDSAKFFGGYVNNWSTDDFSKYVLNKDKKGFIYMARDHGGPWQNPIEQEMNLGLRSAMQSAKESYAEDIKSGFQILHIDPSIDIHGKPSQDEILDRVFELYEFCWIEAQKQKRNIAFEIGTEEQSGFTNSFEYFEYNLIKIVEFCRSNNLPKPLFVVAQTGTRVKEDRNIGSFDSPIRVSNEIPAEILVPKILEICKKYGILMKEHNADYLSDQSLNWHPKLGIPAANVAPEFGVAETIAFIKTLEENNLNNLCNEFIEISYSSKKWEKWILKDSKISEKQKAILAGHYVFAKEEFLLIKEKAKSELSKKMINLDIILREAIKKSMNRYLINFNLM